MRDIDKKYMLRCLDLAAIPGSKVAPNPLVGCVILHNNKVIGEGFHSRYGGPHAEVVAIGSVKDKALLSESTMYVSLEPCSHHGKTPPCTDLIIGSGIPKVVISTGDPNPQVSGRGIQKLRDSGVEVTTSVLEAEGKHLNRRFFTFMQAERPYVTLKWAQSRDHFIAARSGTEGYIRTSISCDMTNILVHKWRSEEQAIMVGGNTFRIDKPRLTNRNWSGSQPVRVILESSEDLPKKSKYGISDTHTIVITSAQHYKINEQGVTHLITNDPSVSQILKMLHQEGIHSILVEGGATVIRSFLESGTWDECRVITGSSDLEDGLPAPELRLEPTSEMLVGKDVIRIYHR